MNEDNTNLNKETLDAKKDDKAWLKPVLFFYAKTTSWIVFPILFAVLGGRYVGESFGSQTVFFVFVILGFLITCLGIYREIKSYKKGLELNKNEPK